MHSATLTNLRELGFSGGCCPVTRVVAPNVSIQYPGFHISYNSRHRDYGSDTTALVLQDRVFFVLNGNHSEALVSAANANGIQGCIDVFIDNIARANGLSEHRMAVGICSDPFSLFPTTLDAIGQSSIDRIALAAGSNQ